MWAQTKVFRLTSFAIFPLIVVIFAVLYRWDVYRYLDLLREDNWVEWLGFMSLFLAGLLSLDLSIQLRQREHRYHWFYVAFGIFCLLMAFEEISWGQRIFSLQSPEFFLGRSDQQEINVHNVLQQQLDFKTTDVAALTLIVYGLLLPVLALNSRVSDLLNRFGLVIPPLFLVSGWFLGALLMLDVPTGWEEELGEFFFALCFLLFMIDELGKHSPQGRLQPFRIPSLYTRLSVGTLDRLAIVVFTLLAFGLHVWQLGSKGLWLGEASYALAAQASVQEIIQHIWKPGTIEPPVWTLILHLWMPLGGSSEASLRLLPALFGVLGIPLLWQILRTVYREDWALRAAAASLLAVSPGLVYFAQDVAAYSFLVTLALLSLYASLSLARRPVSWWLPTFVVANWIMLGLHPYSVTILLAELLFFILNANRTRRDGRSYWLPIGIGLLLSFLPFVMWLLFVPQDIQMWRLLVTPTSDMKMTLAENFGRLWRDLMFGSILWQPRLAGRSYLILPFVLLGVWALVKRTRSANQSSNTHDGGINQIAWAATLLSWVLIPVLPAAILLHGVPSGVLGVVVPGLVTLANMGICYLWRHVRLVGLAGYALLFYCAIVGLVFYFGGYEKSAYREIAHYIAERTEPNSGLVIESNQQYPLTQYYLRDAGTIRPMPQTELTDFGLLEDRPIVPEEVDDQIQSYLREHPLLWLILYADDEIDPNDFVRQYLTAVSHGVECTDWLDVEMCQYISPHAWQPIVRLQPDAVYGEELLLERVSIGLTSHHPSESSALLLTMDWLAQSQPTVDHTVSLRLVDLDGNIIVQRDGLPIGTLLPPTTWRAGDRKPGYMALPLPDDISPGAYTVQSVVYNPANGTPLPVEFPEGAVDAGPIPWAVVTVADSIELAAVK